MKFCVVCFLGARVFTDWYKAQGQYILWKQEGLHPVLDELPMN